MPCLVSWQDQPEGIAAPDSGRVGFLQEELALHVFRDLAFPECTFQTEEHQSYTHQPEKSNSNVSYNISNESGYDYRKKTVLNGDRLAQLAEHCTTVREVGDN